MTKMNTFLISKDVNFNQSTISLRSETIWWWKYFLKWFTLHYIHSAGYFSFFVTILQFSLPFFVLELQYKFRATALGTAGRDIMTHTARQGSLTFQARCQLQMHFISKLGNGFFVSRGITFMLPVSENQKSYAMGSKFSFKCFEL